jgi:hypothetical protein
VVNLDAKEPILLGVCVATKQVATKQVATKQVATKQVATKQEHLHNGSDSGPFSRSLLSVSSSDEPPGFNGKRV